MQPPGFDFGVSPRRYHLGAVLAVVIAFLFVIVAGVRYFESARTLAGLESERARLATSIAERRTPLASRPDEVARLEVEVTAAKTVIKRLGVPWAELFRAIDALSGDDVAFLGLEPDPVTGVVRLTAEARDLASAIDFVERASSLAVFERAYLASHQIVEQQAIPAVRFIMLATWQTNQPEASRPKEGGERTQFTSW